MAAFKKGDVVRLKSGGPRMTVSDVDSYGQGEVLCTWFDGGRRTQEPFDVETIELVDTSSGPTTVQRA